MAVPLLRRIIAEHPIAQTRVEATGAASADPGKDALDEPGNASSKSRTAAELDQAAALLERVIFSDPDESVQREAIDALQHLPRARALVLLKKGVDTHSSRRIRREALETIEEIERKNEE